MFNSSSVGNFSKTSFGNVFAILYDETPIGTFVLFNDHSTDNLSFPLHSNNPIVYYHIPFL